MFRTILLVLLALAAPLYLKFRAGDLETIASDAWKKGPLNVGVNSTLNAVGLNRTGEDLDLLYRNADGSCEIHLAPADPQGQTLGYLEHRAVTDGRLSYLIGGNIVGEFPKLPAIYGHVRYILLTGLGFAADYQPVVALFEPRPCSALDPIRQQGD